jgi:ribosome-associated protein
VRLTAAAVVTGRVEFPRWQEQMIPTDTEPAANRAEVPSPLIPLEGEMQFSAVRAQGAGGQNVNKVSNAVHLRYDVPASSLPEAVKQRLLASADTRISREGVVVIKAQSHRSLEMNRQEAVERLTEMIAAAAHVPKARRATKPTRASQRRRVEAKVQRGQVKALRGKPGKE